MDVRLSAEQQALADAAAHVVDRFGLQTVAQLDDGEGIARLDEAVASSGWRELRVDAGDASPLASGVEVAIVAAELGRGVAPAPFLGPTLAAELRRLVGAAAASDPETVVLDPTFAGLACVGPGQLPPGQVAIDAAGAASALVGVQSDEGLALGSVMLGDPRDGGERVDLTRACTAVGPAAPAVVAGRHRTLDADDRKRWTALALVATSADLVGVMRGAVRLATEYVTDRRQYGVAVGSFQAVQHLLADAHVAAEGSFSAALHAAWALDALTPDDALAAGAVAKAYCARAARTVCEAAIQAHGGIGNTWDCLAHVYLRRALLSTDVAGGVAPNLARVLARRGLADVAGQVA